VRSGSATPPSTPARAPPPSRRPGCSTAARRPTWTASRTTTCSGCPACLDYGRSIEEVNDTVRETITRNDADEVWDLFRKFTKRFSFRDEGGADAVRSLLDTYGGTRIVHGHSPIPYLLGEVGSEDDEDNRDPVIEGPHVYAGGLAIAMDGGVTMAGKLLVQQLPLDT
jgi:hypothetical protein